MGWDILPALQSLGATSHEIGNASEQGSGTSSICNEQVENNRNAPNDDKLVDLIHSLKSSLAAAARRGLRNEKRHIG